MSELDKAKFNELVDLVDELAEIVSRLPQSSAIADLAENLSDRIREYNIVWCGSSRPKRWKPRGDWKNRIPKSRLD